MIATTIISSISVKPFWAVFLSILIRCCMVNSIRLIGGAGRKPALDTNRSNHRASGTLRSRRADGRRAQPPMRWHRPLGDGVLGRLTRSVAPG